MDIAELATLGQKIVEISSKLTGLKEQRDHINAEITALDKEMAPLVARHSAIIAQVLGPPAGPPVPSPAPIMSGVLPGIAGHPAGFPALSVDEVTARIVAYLEDAEPGVSARDVSEALKLDPVIVRQAMNALMRKGG